MMAPRNGTTCSHLSGDAVVPCVECAEQPFVLRLRATVERLRAKLEAVEKQRDHICREAGVVQFQDGEVRNHRAEKAEKDRDELAERVKDLTGHLDATRATFMAAMDEKDALTAENRRLREAFGLRCLGCGGDYRPHEGKCEYTEKERAALQPAPEGETK